MPEYLGYEQAIRDAGIPLEERLGGKCYDHFNLLLEVSRSGDLEQLKGWEKKDRRHFIYKYGFSIPSLEALKVVSRFAPILEVGAGAGYWAYELRKLGVDILATDREEWCYSEKSGKIQHPEYGFYLQWITPIQRVGAVEAIQTYPDRTLLMIWPSLGESWAQEALEAYQGREFIYVGEYRAACADDAFFALLEDRWEETECVRIPRWYGMNDYLWVYRRNS